MKFHERYRGERNALVEISRALPRDGGGVPGARQNLASGTAEEGNERARQNCASATASAGEGWR